MFAVSGDDDDVDDDDDDDPSPASFQSSPSSSSSSSGSSPPKGKVPVPSLVFKGNDIIFPAGVSADAKAICQTIHFNMISLQSQAGMVVNTDLRIAAAMESVVKSLQSAHKSSSVTEAKSAADTSKKLAGFAAAASGQSPAAVTNLAVSGSFSLNSLLFLFRLVCFEFSRALNQFLADFACDNV